MGNETHSNYKCSQEKIQLRHWMVIAVGLMAYDIVAIAFSYFFGLWLRFDFQYTNIPSEYLFAYARFLPWYLVIAVIFFWFMRMYRGIWRFAGLFELLRYGISSLAASVVHAVLITLVFRRMPFSYYIVGAVMQCILLVGIRFSYRFFTEVFCKKNTESYETQRVMIIGAGVAGRNVIRELQQSEKMKCTPCCIIDDNSNKWGRFIDGIPVVGGRNSIQTNAKKYNVDQIYFCIPTIPAKEKKEILNICNETGCRLKSLPGIIEGMVVSPWVYTSYTVAFLLFFVFLYIIKKYKIVFRTRKRAVANLISRRPMNKV